MASYFVLELDTAPPLLSVGAYSWHSATGTIEIPVTVDDPEASVTVTFAPDFRDPVTLERRGDVYSYTFGDTFFWHRATIMVTAVDPVWNASTAIQEIGQEVPTTTTYKAFERYPMNLYEFLRFDMGLSEEEVLKVMSAAEESNKVTAEQRSLSGTDTESSSRGRVSG